MSTKKTKADLIKELEESKLEISNLREHLKGQKEDHKQRVIKLCTGLKAIRDTCQRVHVRRSQLSIDLIGSEMLDLITLIDGHFQWEQE